MGDPVGVDVAVNYQHTWGYNMGSLFSTGRSAAKRQAKAMEKQLELDRQRFEQMQQEMEMQRAQAAEEHERQMAEQRAREQASKLQSQLAEEARVRAEDEVADVAPSFEDDDPDGRRRQRRPLNLSAVLGI